MKYRWVSWNRDRWLSRQGSILPYDKAEHAIASAILTLIAIIFMPLAMACLLVLFIGSLWEWKDAYMPYEKYGWFGGEGFSWKDLIADGIGVSSVFILKLLI